VCLAPLLEAGADTLVLGCTHFPFLVPLIEDVAGPGLTIVDPAPAVARQVKRIAPNDTGSGSLTLATSGDTERFRIVARVLAGIATDTPVLACIWNDD
jgi:glutamate racemase